MVPPEFVERSSLLVLFSCFIFFLEMSTPYNSSFVLRVVLCAKRALGQSVFSSRGGDILNMLALLVPSKQRCSCESTRAGPPAQGRAATHAGGVLVIHRPPAPTSWCWRVT